jgi:rhodanese-related sulfurtransferase
MKRIEINISGFDYAITHTFFILVLLLLLFPGTSFSSTGWQWIEGARVRDVLVEGGGLWLIDVRSLNAYATEHIEGSVNISADSLKYKKFPSKKRLVLVDDSLGRRAARDAAEMLVKNGYENVFVLEGGVTSWKLEGYSMIGKGSAVKGVSTDDLRWAIENKIPLKIYDMRDTGGTATKDSQDFEPVPGKSINERIKNLKGLLNKGQNSGIADSLKKPQTIVLLFSAADDAGSLIEKIFYNAKDDVRYLIGGYEAFVSVKDKRGKVMGSCPTCSESKK